MRIYTLGADSLSEAEIEKVLSKYQIQMVADIRGTVKSVLPHLGRDGIRKLCEANRADYLYLGNELGSPRETGNLSNLDPALYQRGLGILEGLARTRGLLILCSETDPSRCNRKPLAEELAKKGGEVLHLVGVDEVWTPSMSKPDSRKKRPGGKKRKHRQQPRKPNTPRYRKKTARSKMDKIR